MMDNQSMGFVFVALSAMVFFWFIVNKITSEPSPHAVSSLSEFIASFLQRLEALHTEELACQNAVRIREIEDAIFCLQTINMEDSESVAKQLINTLRHLDIFLDAINKQPVLRVVVQKLIDELSLRIKIALEAGSRMQPITRRAQRYFVTTARGSLLYQSNSKLRTWWQWVQSRESLDGALAFDRCAESDAGWLHSGAGQSFDRKTGRMQLPE